MDVGAQFRVAQVQRHDIFGDVGEVETGGARLQQVQFFLRTEGADILLEVNQITWRSLVPVGNVGFSQITVVLVVSRGRCLEHRMVVGLPTIVVPIDILGVHFQLKGGHASPVGGVPIDVGSRVGRAQIHLVDARPAGDQGRDVGGCGSSRRGRRTDISRAAHRAPARAARAGEFKPVAVEHDFFAGLEHIVVLGVLGQPGGGGDETDEVLGRGGGGNGRESAGGAPVVAVIAAQADAQVVQPDGDGIRIGQFKGVGADAGDAGIAPVGDSISAVLARGGSHAWVGGRAVLDGVDVALIPVGAGGGGQADLEIRPVRRGICNQGVKISS